MRRFSISSPSAGEAPSTSGGGASTTSTEGGPSVISRRRSSPTSRSRPRKRTPPNPLARNSSSYRPAARNGSSKRPSRSVSIRRSQPVAGCRRMTVARATGAPVESWTRPSKLPVDAWPTRRGGAANKSAMPITGTANASAKRRRIMDRLTMSMMYSGRGEEQAGTSGTGIQSPAEVRVQVPTRRSLSPARGKSASGLESRPRSRGSHALCAGAAKPLPRRAQVSKG